MGKNDIRRALVIRSLNPVASKHCQFCDRVKFRPAMPLLRCAVAFILRSSATPRHHTRLSTAYASLAHAYPPLESVPAYSNTPQEPICLPCYRSHLISRTLTATSELYPDRIQSIVQRSGHYCLDRVLLSGWVEVGRDVCSRPRKIQSREMMIVDPDAKGGIRSTKIHNRTTTSSCCMTGGVF